MNHVLHSLKINREKAGLTQKEVEDQLGMRNLMMRDYEVGRLKLPISVAIKLANLYKVSLDELVGKEKEDVPSIKSTALTNFCSLFLGSGIGMVFFDPVLKAFLEGNHKKIFESSLFEILTEDYSKRDKKKLVLDINKILFSLACSDGKINKMELSCIRYLLSQFDLKNKYKEIPVTTTQLYFLKELPKYMSRIEIRHFVIWILFFFAFADKQACVQEMEYIEKWAEILKINRSHFLLIRDKFLQGEN